MLPGAPGSRLLLALTWESQHPNREGGGRWPTQARFWLEWGRHGCPILAFFARVGMRFHPAFHPVSERFGSLHFNSALLPGDPARGLTPHFGVCRPCGPWISFPNFPRAYALGYTLPPLRGSAPALALGTNAFSPDLEKTKCSPVTRARNRGPIFALPRSDKANSPGVSLGDRTSGR
jgi:hypothetical protein